MILVALLSAGFRPGVADRAQTGARPGGWPLTRCAAGVAGLVGWWGLQECGSQIKSVESEQSTSICDADGGETGCGVGNYRNFR